jgi:hypothetical protein
MPCTLPTNAAPCPSGTYELPPVKVGSGCYRNCTSIQTTTTTQPPTQDWRNILYQINDPNILRAANARLQGMVDEVNREIQVASGQDIYVYPRMEETAPPPLNLPSRANQKQNIFNKAFNPTNRKLIVLMIAGFLLFLAVTNAK